MRKDSTKVAVLAVGIVVMVAAVALSKTPWFPRPLAPRVANYTIQARLVPTRHHIEGQVLLTWTNRTAQATDRLCFHTYLNAFKNEQTLVMRDILQHEPEMRKKMKPDTVGYVDLQHMNLGSGEPLEFEYGADGTIVWAHLPRPVRPGQTIQVQYSFVAQLPRIVMRSGHVRDFYLVAQWFPKIAVFEEGGWNCRPYYPFSEFYADFGAYDVILQVPRTYVVVASGTLESQRVEADWRTLRYHAEDVHDFVWAVSPRLRLIEDRWGATRVFYAYPPGHGRAANRLLESVRGTLNWFQRVIAPYPYPVLTIVDPPLAAVRAWGMEYPTLITSGMGLRLPAWIRLPETVLVHELGHQYWYGMVATNEFEHAWMDEGINSYTEVRIMNERWGPRAIDIPFLGLWGYHHEQMMGRSMRALAWDAPEQPAWSFRSRGSYAANSYNKIALAGISMDRLFGRDRMDRFLRAYFTRYRFRHPRPEDLLSVLRETVGADAERFLRQIILQPGAFDVAIDDVACELQREPRGYLQFGESRRWQEGHQVSDRWSCRVELTRAGRLQWPVEVKVWLRDGSTRERLWPAKERWMRWILKDLPAPIATAQADPGQRLLLDVNRVNNGWTDRTASQLQGVKRRWWGWLLHLLAFVVTLG